MALQVRDGRFSDGVIWQGRCFRSNSLVQRTSVPVPALVQREELVAEQARGHGPPVRIAAPGKSDISRLPQSS